MLWHLLHPCLEIQGQSSCRATMLTSQFLWLGKGLLFTLGGAAVHLITPFWLKTRSSSSNHNNLLCRVPRFPSVMPISCFHQNYEGSDHEVFLQLVATLRCSQPLKQFGIGFGNRCVSVSIYSFDIWTWSRCICWSIFVEWCLDMDIWSWRIA